ncbi:hypothetical protein LJR219_000400 [Phenylobacterium sp. LjRoot219]|uniref:hypothetical protein n=1 Tax=Phenylobacterium sp. LjRoot219 TaxID=3342283 RepID=UPI003ECFB639
MVAASLLETLKPYLWLALAAFLTGFVSYLALGRAPQSEAAAAAHAPRVSAPASDEWNLPKRI